MTAPGPADSTAPQPAPAPATPEGAALAEPRPEAKPEPRPEPSPVLSLEELKASRAAPKPPPKPAPATGGPAAAKPAPKPATAKPAPAQAPKPQAPAAAPAAAPPPPVPRPVGPAVARARHWGVAASFALLVAAPTGVTAWYMWDRAAPRYASEVGFSVRTEDATSAADLIGGLAALGATASSKDTDILYRFIQSREIVEAVDARLDLRALWAKGDPEADPVFAFHPPGTIEDLHGHWNRMVAVYLDSATGLLDVQVQAFAPEDSRAIAAAIYEESQELINRLSDIAVEDTTRFARDELTEAVERLKVAREAMTRFRNETQIVDPQTSLQGQMGLLTQLEGQLAQALIELDLLRGSAPEGDPRIDQAEARVDVIEARMAEERQKLGLGRPSSGDGAPQGAAFADLVGEYERLLVDQEFAQQTYVAAMAAYDSALAEGRQQTRYLAAHVAPTLAEEAEFPRRWSTTLLTLLFAGLAWAVLTLGAYALKDRR